jgi:O-antigen ligase
MNRESLDRWCERGILAFVLGVLVFSPLAYGAVRIQEFLVVQLFTLGALLLWLARVWLSERPRFILPPMIWGVLAFTGYAVGRYLTCDVEYIGREEVLRILVYASLFFVVLNNLHRQESTQIIGFTLFGLAMVIAGYAVYQFLTGSDAVWFTHSGYKGRGSGTYICPNHLAGLLEMLLPLAVAYAVVGRGKPLTKILIGYAALVMVAGIAVTASRGGWVSTCLALVAVTMLMLTQRAFRLPSAILLVLLIGGITVAATRTNFLTQRFNRAFNAGKVDLDARFEMWNSAVRMWRDHKWVGVGPGHYDLRFRIYRPASLQLQPDRAHNEYLNTLADWGVVGAALIAVSLGLLGVGFVKTWKHVQRGDRAFASNQSDKFAFMLGAGGGLFALALHSVVDFNLHIPANAMIAVTLMALLTSHWRFATDRFWFSARWPGKLVATVAMFVMIFCLGWQELRLGRELYWLKQASHAEENSLAKAALLEKAYAVEPDNFATALEIGEIHQLICFEGKSGYAAHAAKAIEWYQRAVTNNPHSSRNFLRWGTVLDFMGQHDEAERLLMRADELDPNGYYTSAHVGRHYVETGQYAAARPWLERSLLLRGKDNAVAEMNLRLANDRLLEAANDPLIQKLREAMH